MLEILSKDLERAMREVLQGVENDAEETMEELMDFTRDNLLESLTTGRKHGGQTPEDTGEYAAGWECRTEFRQGAEIRVIQNTAKPQLTHLLEYGTWEQTPQPHIRTAYEKAIKRLEEE